MYTAEVPVTYHQLLAMTGLLQITSLGLAETTIFDSVCVAVTSADLILGHSVIVIISTHRNETRSTDNENS